MKNLPLVLNLRHDCRDTAYARPLMRASWLLLNRSIVKRNECYERRAEDSNLSDRGWTNTN